MRFWRQLHDILRQPGSKAVMVTVFEVVGSSPCAPGTRMIATSDGEIFGTIGGGMLEWESQREARDFLQGAPAKRCWKVRKLLGPDLGQCCGGGVTLLFECFFHADLNEVGQLAAAEESGSFTTACKIDAHGRLTRQISDRSARACAGQAALDLIDDHEFSERFARTGAPLVLFGAGHVSKALIRALAPLPFDITWVDSRAGIFPAVLPDNTKSLNSANPPDVMSRVAADSMVVVMTHSHELDLELVENALTCPSFPYVGLIGSKSKCARFRNRLRDRGIEQHAVDRLICPIGITGISGKEPAVIAASVAAQLLTFIGTATDSITVAARGASA